MAEGLSAPNVFYKRPGLYFHSDPMTWQCYIMQQACSHLLYDQRINHISSSQHIIYSMWKNQKYICIFKGGVGWKLVQNVNNKMVTALIKVVTAYYSIINFLFIIIQFSFSLCWLLYWILHYIGIIQYIVTVLLPLYVLLNHQVKHMVLSVGVISHLLICEC